MPSAYTKLSFNLNFRLFRIYCALLFYSTLFYIYGIYFPSLLPFIFNLRSQPIAVITKRLIGVGNIVVVTLHAIILCVRVHTHTRKHTSYVYVYVCAYLTIYVCMRAYVVVAVVLVARFIILLV